MPEQWTNQLLRGLSEYLAAAGVATWRPTGTYTPAETAIVWYDIPDTPDRLVTLTSYVVDDGASADVVAGVQVRIRGTTDPRAMNDIADQIRDLVHRCGRQDWGTPPNQVLVVDAWRQSHTPLGQDTKGRWERSDNYYVRAMRPTANLPD